MSDWIDWSKDRGNEWADANRSRFNGCHDSTSLDADTDTCTYLLNTANVYADRDQCVVWIMTLAQAEIVGAAVTAHGHCVRVVRPRVRSPE